MIMVVFQGIETKMHILTYPE